MRVAQIDAHGCHARRHLVPEWLVGFSQTLHDLGMLFGDIFTLGRVGFDVVKKLFAMIYQTPAFREHNRMGKGLGRQGVSAGCTMELHHMMLSRPRFIGAVE